MSSIASVCSLFLFGFTLFLSAALLFLVQPMVARTLLPHLGGTPLAWNACLVFFQATLLAGYLYANLLHRFRGLRWQPWLQLIVLFTAVTLCFVGLCGDSLLNDLAPRLPILDLYPVLTTLALLAVSIGLPYFALAAISPLVQCWFAHLDHPKASDPYFLFVASNLGGLTALVLYPLVLEPFVPLYAQWLSWNLAVAALGMLVFLVALVAWVSPRNTEMEPTPSSDDPHAPVVPTLIGRGPATWGRCLFWLAASALPVGMMMGVTDYLTLDVAPAPVLWALPLALYLLAFSQAFGRFSPLGFGPVALRVVLHTAVGLIFVVALTAAILVLAVATQRNIDGLPIALACFCFAMLFIVPQSWLAVLQPISVLMVILTQTSLFPLGGMSAGIVFLHLACFYLSARLCLGALAADRPAAPALTTYYTWMGIGGLCGGLFQLLAAPLLFQRGYLEYPLLAALATALRPAWIPNGVTDWFLCLLVLPKRPPGDKKPTPLQLWIGRGFDFVFAMLLAIVVAAAFLVFRDRVDPPMLAGMPHGLRQILSLFADIPLVIALLGVVILYLRPMRFGFALAAVVCLTLIGSSERSDKKVLLRERTHFGVLRVQEEKVAVRGDGNAQGRRDYRVRILMHSTTYHGNVILDPPEMMRYPTTYYHELGPAGKVMGAAAWFTPHDQNPRIDWLKHHRDHLPNDARIAASLVGMGALPAPVAMNQLATLWSEPPYAIVGLGVGTLYAYAHPYQWVDSYELDPAIVALSVPSLPAVNDGKQEVVFGKDFDHKARGNTAPLFPYAMAADARGVSGAIKIGDARRHLEKPGREGFYQMIFIDVFNSDAIPLHMLTVEAIVVYFQKLAPGGIICIHTSNRYADLPAVLQKASDKLGASMKVVKGDLERDEVPGYFTSEWVFLARNQDVLNGWMARQGLDRANNAAQLPFHDVFVGPAPADVLWTDEHASLIPVLRPGLGWPTLIQSLLVVILIFGVLLGLIEMGTAMMPKTR